MGGPCSMNWWQRITLKVIVDKPWRSTMTWPTEIKMDWRGTGRRKYNHRVLEIGGRMPRIEVAGDICWRRQRHTQGCSADDDDDDDNRICGVRKENHNLKPFYRSKFLSIKAGIQNFPQTWWSTKNRYLKWIVAIGISCPKLIYYQRVSLFNLLTNPFFSPLFRKC